MKIYDTRTGRTVPLNARFERGPEDAFTVLSWTEISGRRVRVSIVVPGVNGRPDSIRHVVAPMTGFLWWKRIELP